MDSSQRGGSPDDSIHGGSPLDGETIAEANRASQRRCVKAPQ
jgi:hypothetical protein